SVANARPLMASSRLMPVRQRRCDRVRGLTGRQNRKASNGSSSETIKVINGTRWVSEAGPLPAYWRGPAYRACTLAQPGGRPHGDVWNTTSPGPERDGDCAASRWRIEGRLEP